MPLRIPGWWRKSVIKIFIRVMTFAVHSICYLFNGMLVQVNIVLCSVFWKLYSVHMYVVSKSINCLYIIGFLTNKFLLKSVLFWKNSISAATVNCTTTTTTYTGFALEYLAARNIICINKRANNVYSVLKVRTTEEVGGSGRWQMIVVIYVVLFFYFETILYKTYFRFRLLQSN